MIRVFVYGTLRPSLRAIKDLWTHLPTGNKVGNGTIQGKLYALTPVVPGVRLGGKTEVKGEVVEVKEADLRRFDGLEGHPHMYERQVVPVTLEDGEIIQAWVYEYKQWNKTEALVKSGDWTDTYVNSIKSRRY